MQKAPVMQGSGLIPLDDAPRPNEEVHVFGKNLEERVVTNDDDDDDEAPSLSFSTSQSNRNDTEDDIETIRKRKFDAITGEEDEKTIFQGDFKLFVWDLKTSNWIERGRGQLKLNDSINDSDKSRLIMRVSGTHKIVLNVAVNHSFFRVIASSKMNIRFTDGQTVWAASGSNALLLKELLQPRLKTSSRADCDLERKRTKSEIGEEDVSAPSKKTKAYSEDRESEPKNSDQNESDRKSEKNSGDDHSKTHHSNDASDDHKEDETEQFNQGEKSKDGTEGKVTSGEEEEDGKKYDANEHGKEVKNEESAKADTSEKSAHNNSNSISLSKELPQGQKQREQEEENEVSDYNEEDGEIEPSREEESK